MTSDEPLPDRCGAETRDGGYCENYPVEGSDRCRMHGGQSATGEDNPAYKHGAYSEHLQSDLTDEEREMLEGMVGAFDDPEDAKDLIKEQAAEAYVKYKRSGDNRFLREYRQLVDTFNLAPNADHLDVDADVDGSVEQEVVLGEDLDRRLGELFDQLEDSHE